MRFVIFCLTLSAAILLPIAQAQACSYGGDISDIERDIELAELVVSASIDYVDSTGRNAVLKVERYFKGSAGPYLALVTARPALYYADTTRDYDNSCLNLGPGGIKLNRGEHAYFALYANGDGAYGFSGATMWRPGDVDRYGFDGPVAGMVDFHIHWQSDLQVEAPLPIAEFEDLLLRMTGREEPLPPEAGRYPLRRFLNITTESGKRYRLNPDFSVTWLDPDRWPIAISNDGSHVMFRLAEDELGLQYLALVKKEVHWCPTCEPLGSADFGAGALSVGSYRYNGWLEPVKGWHAQFSPDSNFLAVQEGMRLVIYMFHNRERPGEGEQHGQLMGMDLVASQPVAWDPSSGEEAMAWSADSTTIAFQDERGIWRWDLFEEARAQLLLAASKDVGLLNISRSGAYVRYEQGDSWYLLDAATGEIFERALATPDERNLIYIGQSFPKGVVTARPGRDSERRNEWRQCQAPLSNCPIQMISRYTPFEFFEYQPGWIGLVSRGQIQLYPWYLAMEESHLRVAAGPPATIVAFDYDDIYDRPAIAYGEYAIGLQFSWNVGSSGRMRVTDDYDPVYLRRQLDSPIVDVEWGQPVFLDRR